MMEGKGKREGRTETREGGRDRNKEMSVRVRFWLTFKLNLSLYSVKMSEEERVDQCTKMKVSDLMLYKNKYINKKRNQFGRESSRLIMKRKKYNNE